MSSSATVSQSNKDAENFCERFSFGMYEVQKIDGIFIRKDMF